MSRLVVVSNRVSGIGERKRGNEGGLAVAVLASLRDEGGVWFGWSGQICEEDEARPKVFESGNTTFATLDLCQRDYDEYYFGYANRVLWPLFHYRLDLTDFSRRDMAGYLRVNRIFARRLSEILKPDDIVWIHDYHLIPLAQQLREAGCKNRMGFFLHIPWPAMEVMVALPNHEQIVRALCAYDLIGFQTEPDRRAFLDYVRYEARGKVIGDHGVDVGGRQIQAQTFPISIDTVELEEMAAESAKGRQARRLAHSLAERKLIIGVDRLDYSKGLAQRFDSYATLLRHYPGYRGRVVMLQIAPPSRSDVPEYQEIRRNLESQVGHINASFAEFDWMPIRYLNKGFKRQTLSGFLRLSQVGFVTPLRDGMNLVAKEYVAAQDPEDPGVLILSRFAGAARELDGSLLVNPFDTEGTAEQLGRALDMDREERIERWQSMIDQLRKHDVHAWRRAFIDSLKSLPLAA